MKCILMPIIVLTITITITITITVTIITNFSQNLAILLLDIKGEQVQEENKN